MKEQNNNKESEWKAGEHFISMKIPFPCVIVLRCKEEREQSSVLAKPRQRSEHSGGRWKFSRAGGWTLLPFPCSHTPPAPISFPYELQKASMEEIRRTETRGTAIRVTSASLIFRSLVLQRSVQNSIIAIHLTAALQNFHLQMGLQMQSLVQIPQEAFTVLQLDFPF